MRKRAYLALCGSIPSYSIPLPLREIELRKKTLGPELNVPFISEVCHAGRKRRMGFGKRGKTSFTVHRSEEVIPGDVKLSKQGSSASSEGDLSADGDRFEPIINQYTLQPPPPPFFLFRYPPNRSPTRSLERAHTKQYIERYRCFLELIVNFRFFFRRIS